MRAYWSAIDAADWDGVAALLADTFTAHYPASAEHFDAAGFVHLNAAYPGRWRAEVLDLVADDDRVVTRARVDDGSEAHVVASFATVTDGRLARLVEVWAEEGDIPPADRRPASS
jgi:hypothetical protein